MNFTAIHSSAFAIASVILDIMSSPHTFTIMEQLREEVMQVLRDEKGWTKEAVAKMIRIDSAIRESMRLEGVLSRGLTKVVEAEEGLTVKDQNGVGTHIPKGNQVSVSIHSIHHDAANYENSDIHDAFRFSREWEQADMMDRTSTPGAEKENEDASSSSRNPVLVSYTPDFLAFGYGRSACPGRFFAAEELKLLLAYIVLNYDIKPLERRPKALWIGDAVIPPLKTKICVS
jgi:cytochrome P450